MIRRCFPDQLHHQVAVFDKIFVDRNFNRFYIFDLIQKAFVG
jgi:hypothetical protein